MVLPSGESQLSFNQIRAEFGTDNVKWVLDSEEPSGFKAEGTSGDNANGPVRLGQYRRDDPSFSNENIGDMTGLPLDEGVYTSGTMTVDVFHGKKLNTVVDLYSSGSSNYNYDARTERFDNGNYTIVGGYRSSVTPATWQGGKKIILHVNNTFSSSGASNMGHVALLGGSWPANTDSRMDFGDECIIVGKGGNGGHGGRGADNYNDATGQPGTFGTSALALHNDTSIGVVASGAQILGGGGGGGGGAGASQDDWGDHNEAGGGGGGGGAGNPAGDGGGAGEGGGGGGEGSLNEGGGGGAGGDNAEARGTYGGKGGDSDMGSSQAESGEDGATGGGKNTRGGVGEGGPGGYQLLWYD